MPRNLQDRLADALKARGHAEVQHSSRKYRVFEAPPHPETKRARFFYVGKAGGLRLGLNMSISISLERSKIRSELLAECPK